MDRNEIKITVGGTIMSGKSTICKIISDALIQKGFNPTIIDSGRMGMDHGKTVHNEKTKALVERDLQIEVKTVQIARTCFENRIK